MAGVTGRRSFRGRGATLEATARSMGLFSKKKLRRPAASSIREPTAEGPAVSHSRGFRPFTCQTGGFSRGTSRTSPALSSSYLSAVCEALARARVGNHNREP
jgi:hypothetical protein